MDSMSTKPALPNSFRSTNQSMLKMEIDNIVRSSPIPEDDEARRDPLALYIKADPFLNSHPLQGEAERSERQGVARPSKEKLR